MQLMDAPARPSAPARTRAQRMRALERANDIRSRRAQLKEQMKRRHVSTVDVLRDPPEFLESMKVFDLLLATPKFGRVKVNKILGRCRISPSKTVGGLSERQRGELVALTRRR